MEMVELIREKYRGTLIVAGGFDRDTAEAWLEQGKADLIAFGRKFLANPDLPARLRRRAPLNPDDPTTYYGGDAKRIYRLSEPCPGAWRAAVALRGRKLALISDARPGRPRGRASALPAEEDKSKPH